MKGLKELSRPAWLRYGIAAASSVVALLLTSLLWPIFRHMPNMPSFLAVSAGFKYVDKQWGTTYAYDSPALIKTLT